MNHDVYICYDEKDQITADAMCHALESNRIKCWLKTRDLGVNHMVDAIMEAINQASVMVLIFSSHSKNSNFVNTEVDIAFTENIPILVFKIDESKLDGGLEFFLNNKHWLDAYPEPEVKFGSLIVDTSKLLGRPISKPIVGGKTQHVEESQPVEEEVSEPEDIEEKVSEPETVVAKEEVSEPEDIEEKVSEPEPVVAQVKEKKVEPKKESKPVKESKDKSAGGSSILSNNKIPILIAVVVIAIVAIVGCYFVFNSSVDFEPSTVIISDSAYMDVPKNPNATSKADKNGVFYYTDKENGINITSCNSNITKKSGITKVNNLVSTIESDSNKIEENGAVIYEKDGVYSIIENDTKYDNVIIIQSTNKNLLLKCWESIKYHDPLDSLKIEDTSSVVNATHETQTAIQQAESSSSTTSYSSVDSSDTSSSSSSSSSGVSYSDWDSGSSSSSSSSGGVSYSDWGSSSSGSSGGSSSSGGVSYSDW